MVIVYAVQQNQCSISILDRVNNLDGRFGKFKRVVTKPRPNFGEDLERAGVYYWGEKAIIWDDMCDVSDTYWNDLGAMEIADKATEAKALEATTNLHGMMLEAVDQVVNDDKLLKLFSIPQLLWEPIKKSWKEK